MRPTYALRIGQVSCTDDNPAGGPISLVVNREICVPVDVAQVRLVDRSDISPGDSFTLDLGMDQSPTRVFTGEVIQVEAGIASATVVAIGAMRSMIELRVALTWSSASIGTIAHELAAEAGMSTGTIDDGPTLPRFAVDRRRNAHAQLCAVAESFGLEVYADRQGALVMRSLPGSGVAGGLGDGLGSIVGTGVAGATGTLGAGQDGIEYGANVLDARAEVRPAAWESVVVGGQSPASTRGESASDWLTTDEEVARAESGSGSRQMLAVASVARTRDLARAAADGIRAWGSRTAHLVTATTPGRPDVDLGDDISLARMPDGELGRSGRVRLIRHRLDPSGGFTTTITAGLTGSAAEEGALP